MRRGVTSWHSRSLPPFTRLISHKYGPTRPLKRRVLPSVTRKGQHHFCMLNTSPARTASSMAGNDPGALAPVMASRWHWHRMQWKCPADKICAIGMSENKQELICGACRTAIWQRKCILLSHDCGIVDVDVGGTQNWFLRESLSNYIGNAKWWFWGDIFEF